MRQYDRAPNYKFGRLVTADDVISNSLTEDWGWAPANYEFALFHIIPIQTVPANKDAFFVDGGDISTLIGTPTSNPAAEAYFWDPASKLWLKHNPALTFAAAGAGIATEIEVPVYGRKVGLKITGVSGGQGVVILASAYFRAELE